MRISTKDPGNVKEFRALLRVLVNGEHVEINRGIIELAKLNKVLLHVLRVVNYEGELRWGQENGLRRVINVVSEVEDALNGIEHAFIKLIKPVVYVPADVDVLVRRDQVLLAAARLIRRGYRLLLYEPYTITLVKDGINVDLYVHPSVADLTYARGEDFLRLKTVGEYHGVKVSAINRSAEVVLTILHAIYKEGIITLNDALTIINWLSDDAVNLCEQLRCGRAMELALSIVLSSIAGSLVLPYKLSMGLWFMNLLMRVLGHGEYAPSVFMGIRRIGDSRSMTQLINRIIRISY
ncbi:hypothetical protein [Vulcanisaeta distributa]|uniref:Uncharacterized protein n=1 Tax=Vulcanisaeta distributa (strain DSM 14429 / JCM 11212 / NBRC 100878 / IC-017) TaxID=572478 RepID=E1QUV4_VULDI|nr:hypothetical protein [Vulcanisaeta distributa]ADN49957.1 hypothetical protein Vdis_0559 [Vulcanisaeta distributa DSM 14429]